MQPDQLKNIFQKIFNSHGDAFHHRIVDSIATLYDEDGSTGSQWYFHAVEFPVLVRGHDTRIDFILQRKNGAPFFIVGECKRVNPGLSNWCFVRAPLVNRNRTPGDEPVFLECIQRDTQNSLLPDRSRSTRTGSLNDAYHIGIEIPSGEKGDNQGTVKRAIEDAATQVCKGLNGFVETLKANHQIWQYGRAYILPVIFTTADLWVSNIDLRSTDATTGTVNLASATFEQVNRVCYQYHESQGIKHNLSDYQRPTEIGKFLEAEFIRTIPIVTPRRLADFLVWSSNLELHPW